VVKASGPSRVWNRLHGTDQRRTHKFHAEEDSPQADRDHRAIAVALPYGFTIKRRNGFDLAAVLREIKIRMALDGVNIWMANMNNGTGFKTVSEKEVRATSLGAISDTGSVVNKKIVSGRNNMKCMKNLKSLFVVVGCILISWCSPVWGANLPFGHVETGSISEAAQSNSYTFSANANDVIDFTMVATSGTLSPKICLYNPVGTEIECASDNIDGDCVGGSVTEMNTVTLASTGTYTLLVNDCLGTNTGNYAIYSQRTNDPSGAVNLPFGKTEAGTITGAAQSSSYTFSADANDVVDLTSTATSGTLSPKIRLYSPAGALVASASDNIDGDCVGGSITEMNAVALLSAGTYTVLVGDCTDTNAGKFEIYAQRTDDASGSIISFGQTKTGTISEAAQSNTYDFSGSANDVVDFTMVTTSGSLSPKIRVYNPAGGLVASASDNIDGDCVGGSITELNTVTLPSTGTYTVLVGDCSDTNTGKYDIYAQRTNNPSGASNLPFGKTETGTISAAAQSHTYTFSANANDVVDFTVVAASGSLSPKIRVYSPTGALVASASDNIDGDCVGGSITELNTVTLPSTGKFTVLIGDCSDTNSGEYDIYAQRTNKPSGALNLPFGETESGTISEAAQSNSYTFSANASDVLDVTMVATSGSLSPKIRLYSPTGALLASASNNIDGDCVGGSTTEMNNVSLPSTGKYTLLVGDCADTNTGNYNISSECLGTCPAGVDSSATTPHLPPQSEYPPIFSVTFPTFTPAR